jgi:hypothetical protein
LEETVNKWKRATEEVASLGVAWQKRSANRLRSLIQRNLRMLEGNPCFKEEETFRRKGVRLWVA